MQILSAEQIRAWDQYTISYEPVSSVDLMERAANLCVKWLLQKGWAKQRFLIFCGRGNNGGDGLAIARMLLEKEITVSIYILEFDKRGSDDFQVNLQRLHDLPAADIHFIQSEENFPNINAGDIVVDALFGTGLNSPLKGLTADLVNHINQQEVTTVAIDLPSGLLVDSSSWGNPVIKATYTLTFQCYKLGLLVQENAPFIGDVRVLDIGLHQDYLHQIHPEYCVLDELRVRKLYKPRNRFAHKGTYGHALVIGGSYGKMGAAVLSTKACMSAGAGLTTALIPRCGYQIMQVSAPEAMTVTDEEETHLTNLPEDLEKYAAMAIGPGLGTHTDTQKLLSYIIRRYSHPLVIDADGLNCLALNKDWLQQLPPYSILTPHPKEFDGLFGEHKNDFERIETAKKKAKEYRITVVLKSHHSLIALPNGPCYFNVTGNAGMAKGGSGDVLTGILVSLLAQGYSPAEAVKLGVYLHGWAGDFAAANYSKEAMLPSHVVQCLSDVFLALNRQTP